MGASDHNGIDAANPVARCLTDLDAKISAVPFPTEQQLQIRSIHQYLSRPCFGPPGCAGMNDRAFKHSVEHRRDVFQRDIVGQVILLSKFFKERQTTIFPAQNHGLHAFDDLAIEKTFLIDDR